MVKRRRTFLHSSDSEDSLPDSKAPDIPDSSDSDDNKKPPSPPPKKREKKVPLKLSDFAYGGEYPETTTSESTEAVTTSKNHSRLCDDVAKIAEKIKGTPKLQNAITVTADVHLRPPGLDLGRKCEEVRTSGGVGGVDSVRVLKFSVGRGRGILNKNRIKAPAAPESTLADFAATSVRSPPEDGIFDDVESERIEEQAAETGAKETYTTPPPKSSKQKDKTETPKDEVSEFEKCWKYMSQMNRELSAQLAGISHQLAALEHSVFKIGDSNFPNKPTCIPLKKVEDIDRFEEISDAEYTAVVDFLGSLSYGVLNARANVVLTEAMEATIAPALTTKGKKGTRKLEGTRFCSALYAAVSKNVDPKERPTWSRFLDAVRGALKSAKMRYIRSLKQ